MPLLALHTVELQSALQFLPLADLLSFCRCSPATRAVASSPFVFRHVSPVVSTSTKLEEALCRSSPLLRLVPLRIVWQPANGVQVREHVESITQAQLLVRGFDASGGVALDMDLWDLVLNCSWARGLRKLKLHEADPQTGCRSFRRTFDLIAALPHLAQLHMIVKERTRDLTPWFALAASTSLTHATFDDRSWNWIGGQPFNLQAPNLTSLHLNSQFLMGQDFAVFFAHQSMRQLRRLHLQRLRVEAVLNGQAQAMAGFTQLVNLEEITLTEVLCSSWLLDEFHRLPLLRLVTMQLHWRSQGDTSFIPDGHYVEMLRRSPQLHCVITPPARQGSHSKAFRTRWEILLRSVLFVEFGARMRIQSIPNLE